MKFLADENIPKRCVDWLRGQNVDISSISEVDPGISDVQVVELAIFENRTILTLDRDFGALIFKLKLKPKAGVIFFRLVEFRPIELSEMLLELIEGNESFENSFLVIDKKSIRRRKY